jgi:hypothetical protein
MVLFRSSLSVLIDELPVMLSEIGLPMMVIAGLVGWEERGPCAASKLGEDAGRGAQLIFRSAIGILLWLGPSIEENACDFFAGFCV